MTLVAAIGIAAIALVARAARRDARAARFRRFGGELPTYARLPHHLNTPTVTRRR